jgi:hypothetical protein
VANLEDRTECLEGLSLPACAASIEGLGGLNVVLREGARVEEAEIAVLGREMRDS